ncbi:MAG: single-stranded DNA-binding protein [Deltaproteobacteria bacterium]|jgi:single-strand DNA-binding protein|nr:single-stranded DNA-binding protein [Deltaproteobacteria bacterium]
MLNRVTLIGWLGNDPEIRFGASGSPFMKLRISTKEFYTDREGKPAERTSWHNVVVFQQLAENCKNYLAKGSLVYVEGSLQTRKWQDQQGQDRYITEVKANTVKFLDRKGSGHGAPGGGEPDSGSEDGYGSPMRRQSGKPLPGGDEDMGSPFPSGASGSFPGSSSGMDDVPF